MACVYRNTANCAEERTQRRFAVKFLINDVTNRPGRGELKDERVHPRDVIRQKEKAALGQIVETERADAIKKTDERSAKKIERALTHGHVRHRFLFTISLRPFICQSAISNGNERPSCPRRPNRARAPARGQSF